MSDRVGIQNEVDGPRVTRCLINIEIIKAFNWNIVEGMRTSDGILDQLTFLIFSPFLRVYDSTKTYIQFSYQNSKKEKKKTNLMLITTAVL